MSADTTCPECEGDGRMVDLDVEQDCDACDGTGHIGSQPKCDGCGQPMKPDWIFCSGCGLVPRGSQTHEEESDD